MTWLTGGLLECSISNKMLRRPLLLHHVASTAPFCASFVLLPARLSSRHQQVTLVCVDKSRNSVMPPSGSTTATASNSKYLRVKPEPINPLQELSAKIEKGQGPLASHAEAPLHTYHATLQRAIEDLKTLSTYRLPSYPEAAQSLQRRFDITWNKCHRPLAAAHVNVDAYLLHARFLCDADLPGGPMDFSKKLTDPLDELHDFRLSITPKPGKAARTGGAMSAAGGGKGKSKG